MFSHEDTRLTFSVFKNSKMLLNISNSRVTLKTFTSRGRHHSRQIAESLGFFRVRHNSSSMIILLTWSGMSDKFWITTDSSLVKYITVHTSHTKKMIFGETGS